jgi:hypothetical protein
MTTTNLSIPETALKIHTPTADQPIPAWRAEWMLRGINPDVIPGVRPSPNGKGWLYPFRQGDRVNERFKAYPNQDGPKNAWYTNGRPGNKPPGVTFYDPDGHLKEHIAAANGVLILANGDPAVFACKTAGILNVTCTMLGESAIPDWALTELHALAVNTVIYPPDCDDTGRTSAGKWRDHLRDSGIILITPQLPFAPDSKKDLADLWLMVDQDAGRMVAALAALPLADLPAAEVEDRPTCEPSRRSDPPADFAELYEAYCLEIEQAAIRAWIIPPDKGNGWSRKNFSSPLRTDRHPSARWNYQKHGFKDFTTGEFYNTAACADLLGAPSWETYKAENRPQKAPDYWGKSEENAAPAIPPLPHTDGRRLVEAGLHAAVMVWKHGLQPDGLTRDTHATGIKELRDTLKVIYVGNGTHTSEQDHVVFQNQHNSKKRGRPATEYQFVPKEQLRERLKAFFKGRAIQTRYPDLPANVQPDFADPERLPDPQVEALNTRRAVPYAETMSDRAEAQAALERDLAMIDHDSEVIERGTNKVYDVPDVANVADFKKALIERTLAANPDGIGTGKLRRAAGISPAAMTRARQQYNTIPIPVFSETPITSADEIMVGRRQTAELIAPDGQRHFIDRETAQDAETRAWLAQYSGVVLRKSQGNIEKRRENASTEEQHASTRYTAEQRRKTQAWRKTPPPETPPIRVKNELLPTGYSTAWLEKQLQYTPGAETIPTFDAETGEVYTPGERWQMLGEKLTAEGDLAHEGATMPTFTTYTAPAEERESEDQRDPTRLEFSKFENLTIGEDQHAPEVKPRLLGALSAVHDHGANQYNGGDNITSSHDTERGDSAEYKLARLKRDNPALAVETQDDPPPYHHPGLARLKRQPVTIVDGRPYTAAQLERRRARLALEAGNEAAR